MMVVVRQVQVPDDRCDSIRLVEIGTTAATGSCCKDMDPMGLGSQYQQQGG
jgi:hypothetical protein